jgi:4-hydroxy-3-methylbut-2-enyl diphosphate reductase
MEVVRAKTAGFCMGVILALQKLDDLVENGTRIGGIFTLGQIIHNPQVIEAYALKGVLTAETSEEIPEGATVVIRAHGVPRNVEDQLVKRGVSVIDATCPKVKKAQLLIGDQTRAGRTLLLYGEERHPEVKGLLSYSEAEAHLFETKEKLDEIPLLPGKPYCLAAQTTQDREVFEAVAGDLVDRRKLDVAVLRTICEATKQRQEEAVRIARKVEFMVVIGGFDSGNTRRLTQVVAAQNTHCLHVETARDLPLEDLKRIHKIGLTAGASTPKDLIDEIHRVLQSR